MWRRERDRVGVLPGELRARRIGVDLAVRGLVAVITPTTAHRRGRTDADRLPSVLDAPLRTVESADFEEVVVVVEDVERLMPAVDDGRVRTGLQRLFDPRPPLRGALDENLRQCRIGIHVR